MPQMVQVGNEITNGMIWPDGHTPNWNNLATLIKAGIAGVKDVDTTIKIVMHIDRGGDNAGTRRWMDSIITRGVKFDILGQSCYTSWQGPASGWRNNFADLITRYPKHAFVIAEYSQDKRAANDVMFNLPNERGLGTFIWEPIRYAEAVFTQSGSNRHTNSLIDLYPVMSKDYGNDAMVTVPKKWGVEVPRKYFTLQRADNKLRVILPESRSAQAVKLMLCNSQGRVLRHWDLAAGIASVTTPSLPHGIYFGQINDGTNRLVQKIDW